MKLESFSFTGHETFPFRYTWLKKAVDQVSSTPTVFGAEDAMVRLGVGKNMVSSIRHWARVCAVLEDDPDVEKNRGRSLRVTGFGRALFGDRGWDPYMEDPATPWLLHWRIASTPESATTWYWAFNHLSQLEFTKDELMRQLMDLAKEQTGARLTPASLSRDVDCFLRTYVPSRISKNTPVEDTLECPLVELGLLRELEHRGSYARVRQDHRSLPDSVFAFALVEFLRRGGSEAKTVSLDQVAYAAGSPGRVFSLSEEGVVRRLERLHTITNGGLSFDETAGLRQVLVKELPRAEAILSAYYNRSSKLRAAEA